VGGGEGEGGGDGEDGDEMVDDTGHDAVERGQLGIEPGDRAVISGFNLPATVLGLLTYARVRFDDGMEATVPLEDCGELK
jgi:hypothetical protein